MEFEYKKMKDELDQIKHEVKVMGNTRNYIETSDLVKWLDNNLGENQSPMIVSPKDLALIK